MSDENTKKPINKCLPYLGEYESGSSHRNLPSCSLFRNEALPWRPSHAASPKIAIKEPIKSKNKKSKMQAQQLRTSYVYKCGIQLPNVFGLQLSFEIPERTFSSSVQRSNHNGFNGISRRYEFSLVSNVLAARQAKECIGFL